MKSSNTEKTAVKLSSSVSSASGASGVSAGAPSPKGNPKSGLGWSLSGLALVALLYVGYFVCRDRIDLSAPWGKGVFYAVGGLACVCFGMGVGHSIKVLQRARRR